MLSLAENSKKKNTRTLLSVSSDGVKQLATLSGFFEWNIMTKMFSQQILENTNPKKAKPAQTEKEAVIEKNRDTSAKKFINGGKPILNRNVTRNNVDSKPYLRPLHVSDPSSTHPLVSQIPNVEH